MLGFLKQVGFQKCLKCVEGCCVPDVIWKFKLERRVLSEFIFVNKDTPTFAWGEHLEQFHTYTMRCDQRLIASDNLSDFMELFSGLQRSLQVTVIDFMFVETTEKFIL